MASRDIIDSIHTAVLIPPTSPESASNTPVVSNIIDTSGFEKVALVLAIGAVTGTGATYNVTLAHGDDPALADGAAVATSDVVGTLALASFDSTSAQKTRKLGYIGGKRYVQLTVTPVGNTGSFDVAGVAVLGQPRNLPTANPPQ